MTHKTGIWIDHKQALLVTIDENNKVQRKRIESGFEGREREDGEGKSRNTARMGSHYITDEKGFENRQKEILRKFYLEVLLRIKNDADVYIFGPGSAKKELADKIKNYQSLNINIVRINDADKMTDNQIAAEIKSFFNIKTSVE